MTIISLIGLIVALFLFAVSPGPGVFITVARSMASGFQPAVIVISGIILGDIVYLLFAIFGLAIVAQTLGDFFIVVKICGGLYLVWLGLKAWHLKPSTQIEGRISDKKHGAHHFFSGFFVSLSNPKVILFYCSFLPAFIDLGALTRIDIVLIVAVVAIVLAVVLTIYAFLANQARQLFTSKLAVKRFHRIAGGMMVATGVIIAARS